MLILVLNISQPDTNILGSLLPSEHRLMVDLLPPNMGCRMLCTAYLPFPMSSILVRRLSCSEIQQIGEMTLDNSLCMFMHFISLCISTLTLSGITFLFLPLVYLLKSYLFSTFFPDFNN